MKTSNHFSSLTTSKVSGLMIHPETVKPMEYGFAVILFSNYTIFKQSILGSLILLLLRLSYVLLF